MSYLRYLLGTTALLLALVAVLNITIDPGAIYIHASASPDAYTSRLIGTPHGLWWPNNSYADRQLKKSLARFAAKKDCVVVGSSRAMQTGTSRTDSMLRAYCDTILNLAVSSGGIEDETTLAWLAVKHGPPRKMFLGIDPWTFLFNSTPRWTYYARDYALAAHDIGVKTRQPLEQQSSTRLSLLGNIFNLEYTLRSFHQLAAEIQYGGDRFTPREAPRIDPVTGARHPILMPDGSLTYSADYLAGKGVHPVPLGGEPFSERQAPLDPDAVRSFARLLQWLKQQRVQPFLLLTPFHPNVLAAQRTPDVQKILETEKVARKLAKENGVVLIGTFDPTAAHCPAAEFYDFMHASTHCLAGLAPAHPGSLYFSPPPH